MGGMSDVGCVKGAIENTTNLTSQNKNPNQHEQDSGPGQVHEG